MDSPDPPSPPPIPPELHSDYEERPFHHCTRCGETLADFTGGFQISKAYKKGECVLEYALCDHCRMTMMQEFSNESKQRLAHFQNEAVHMDHGLTHCAVCGVGRIEGCMDDFVITGLCEGTALHHGLLMCGDCGDAVQELISVPTRDTWRRFVDDNFPGPPPSDALPTPDHHPLHLNH
ncbi:MAG: hypothetical protein QE274_04520 [Verrucomicrobiaceae bacterium]|nr:hypothetical protein [Verrucomicrobiaceae bacterium]